MPNSINIIDGYPGIGKTNWAIQNINETNDKKILYITPYLDEVKRIINNCQKKNFVQPDSKVGFGSKMFNLIDLVEQGRNIVTTHALFSNLDERLYRVLKEQNYVLYLDEALQVIQKFNITKSNLESEDDYSVTKRKTEEDLSTLIKKELIRVDQKDGRVIWIDNSDKLSQYEDLRKNANLGLIYSIKDTLLWVFPERIFKDNLFLEIYILTHRFHSQIQSYYFRFNFIPYKIFFLLNISGRYEITDNQSLCTEREWKTESVKHIKIIEDKKLNEIGDIYRARNGQTYKSALSKSWYDTSRKKHKEKLIRVKRNLENYFKNKTSSRNTERMWTCFKSDMNLLTSKNVNCNSWLAINARATNEWGEKEHLAYLINRFIDPCYEEYFLKRNIKIDEDGYAISECIQWIWRSRIRNFENITIYIPSVRMRRLLKKYLEIWDEAPSEGIPLLKGNSKEKD